MQDEGAVASNSADGSKMIPLVLRGHRLLECTGWCGSPEEPVKRSSLQQNPGQEPRLPSPGKTQGREKSGPSGFFWEAILGIRRDPGFALTPPSI